MPIPPGSPVSALSSIYVHKCTFTKLLQTFRLRTMPTHYIIQLPTSPLPALEAEASRRRLEEQLAYSCPTCLCAALHLEEDCMVMTQQSGQLQYMHHQHGAFTIVSIEECD
jgi:aminoglycoside phosphotransferase